MSIRERLVRLGTVLAALASIPEYNAEGERQWRRLRGRGLPTDGTDPVEHAPDQPGAFRLDALRDAADRGGR